MPFLQTTTHTLFYTRVNGRASTHRLPLLLLHGAGGSHLVWPKELLRLPQTAVYALDLPAHGRSSGPVCATIEAHATAVVAFLEAQNLPRVLLAGHSMGGAIAQMVALRRPDLVGGLALLGSGAKLRVNPAILEQVSANYEGALDSINQFAWSPETPPPLVALGRSFLSQCPPEVLAQDFRACNQFDLTDQVANLLMPTLIVTAVADRLTPPKLGHFLHDHIPHSQLTTLADAGHMMMVEQPTAVADAIGHFLAGL